MELGCIQAVRFVGNRRVKCHAVLCRCGDDLGVCSLQIIRMDKIDIGVLRHAGIKLAALANVYGIPADLRDFKPHIAREFYNFTRQHAEALDAFRFFAFWEQQLKP